MGSFNSVVFPKPTPTYNRNNTHLIWIPKRKSKPSCISPLEAGPKEGIPCLFLSVNSPTNRLVVYFHGNAEDLGMSEYFFYDIMESWRCSVLVVEYPTYGVYNDTDLSEEQIEEDAEDVYHFLTQTMQLGSSQIIIFGRSMGSGPATYLASKRKVSGLILFSPYLSVQEAASDMVGSFLSYFVKERFCNKEHISSVACPTIILHGLADTVIPHTHGERLFELLPNVQKLLLTPADMTHNNFNMFEDLIDPVQHFFTEKKVFSEIGSLVNVEEFLNFRK